MKRTTGARRGFIPSVKRRWNRLWRAKLARASSPFNWQADSASIDARLAKIGPIKIKDQFQSFSCGGQAAAYWLGIVWAVRNNQPYKEISAKSLYAPIAYSGGGTTDGALQNQIMNVGALEEAILPSYRPDGSTDEIWMTDKSWMTEANMILEDKYDDWVKVTVDNTQEAIAEAIRDNIAVIWHIESHFDGGAPELWLSNYPRYAGIADEGHFMCAHRAYLANNVVPTIQALQSFGLDVPNGVQNFDVNNYIGTPRIVDVFTFVPKYVPHPINPGQMIPNPAIISWQQRLFNYFRAVFEHWF